MAIAYSRHHMTIGPVADVAHFVKMLQHTNVPIERDHLVQNFWVLKKLSLFQLLLLSKLVLNKANARELLKVDLVKILVDLASLAHLHTNRATLNNQVIFQCFSFYCSIAEQRHRGAKSSPRGSRRVVLSGAERRQKGPFLVHKGAIHKIKYFKKNFNCRWKSSTKKRRSLRRRGFGRRGWRTGRSSRKSRNSGGRSVFFKAKVI